MLSLFEGHKTLFCLFVRKYRCSLSFNSILRIILVLKGILALRLLPVHGVFGSSLRKYRCPGEPLAAFPERRTVLKILLYDVRENHGITLGNGAAKRENANDCFFQVRQQGYLLDWCKS